MPTIPLSTSSWRFRDATKPSPWRKAMVPGCVHTDLIRLGLINDPFWGRNEEDLQWIEERDWEYQTSFQVSASLLREDFIELAADGLDTVATIFVNGRKVAATENMFIGYRWNIRRFIKKGRNELRVHFGSAMRYIRRHRLAHQPREINDPVGRCTVMRKQQCQFGWDWGPRFVTAGIWRDVRLEAWSVNRLKNVHVIQEHHLDGCVDLHLAPELVKHDDPVTCRWSLSLDGKLVSAGTGSTIALSQPRLWWPNGHGEQPLYDLEVNVVDGGGRIIGPWKCRIGLRTIRLDRQPDEWGETFRFVVNGRAIFSKGANWIPAHSFVAGLTRKDYERDLRSAADANMNMIRVWGGGIYESEDFYDLCDELGLLVWQDFMFACTRYPADPSFRESVAEEADYQVRRLRHRACLALWCGNNEVYHCNPREHSEDPVAIENYRAIFNETLPAAVAAWDGVTAYWPGSPWRGSPDDTHAAGETRGDTHYWDVWHKRHPVKDYENHRFRFCSEFGMQSYSSPETQATFCSSDDDNVFGPTMENHQKNRSGNQIILDYVSRRYRFPNGQDNLIYLSQLNQAYCMQTGVEHWRRHMPRCMGALYWQLNDCWPVASWSSIEFTGHWKALHYVARRFFAPALVTAHVPGDESPTIGNYRRSTIEEVEIFTVYDRPEATKGIVVWSLEKLEGGRILHGKKSVRLRYGESIRRVVVDLRRHLKKFGRDHIFLRIALDVEGERVSEDTVFFAPPRFINLRKARTRVGLRKVKPGHFRIIFTSDVFQHRFAFDLGGLSHTSSDNFFELYAGEKKVVDVRVAGSHTVEQVRKKLKYRSLADTY